MITHNQARFYMAFKYLNKKKTFEMWDYITQQEKKDELLGLYRNLSMETDVFERSKYWEQINKIELEELNENNISTHKFL